MSSVAEDPVTGWGALQRAWRELRMPKGWRPQITPEAITAPPLGEAHNKAVAALSRLLAPSLPADCGVFENQSVGIAEVPGIFMPDVLVARSGDVPGADAPDDAEPLPSRRALLAVEVTAARNADNDRVRKLRHYALGEIPLYLLVDRHDPRGPVAAINSEPEGGVYRRAETRPLGRALWLPEPLGVELPTDER